MERQELTQSNFMHIGVVNSINRKYHIEKHKDGKTELYAPVGRIFVNMVHYRHFGEIKAWKVVNSSNPLKCKFLSPIEKFFLGIKLKRGWELHTTL